MMLEYIIEVIVWTIFLYIFSEIIRRIIEFFIPKNTLKGIYCKTKSENKKT